MDLENGLLALYHALEKMNLRCLEWNV